MGLFRNKKTIRLNPSMDTALYEKKTAQLPDDLLTQCPHCRKILLNDDLKENYCCTKCQTHLHFPAYDRIAWLLDSHSFEEYDRTLTGNNPLNFPHYKEKLDTLKSQTGLNEAIVTGVGKLSGQKVAIAVMDSRFIMASMGGAVGEKIVRLFELATKRQLPVVLYIASGGARMQEGIISLMQMAKVSMAVERHSAAGLLYVAILTHPTTGGVTASFAMQADIILAEPKATIGFAGRRVIEQTLRKSLPDAFQSAEKVLENGFIDAIVPRVNQKALLTQLIALHMPL